MQISNPAIQVPCEIPADTFFFQPFWQRSHSLALVTGSPISFTVATDAPFMLFPQWIPSYCCPFNQQSLSFAINIDGSMLMGKIEVEPNGDVKIYNPLGWHVGQQFLLESQNLLCLQLEDISQ